MGSDFRPRPVSGLDVPPWLKAVAAYYLGVPLLTALFLGLNHSGSAHHLGTGSSIVYWLGITLPFWALLELTSRAFQAAFRTLPAKVPGLVATVAGSLASMALFAAYIEAYTPSMIGVLAPSVDVSVPSTLLSSDLSLGMALKFSVVPLYWVGITYLFERVYGYPNYYGIAPERVSPVPLSDRQAELFDRDSKLGKLLPAKLGTDIVSLHAEDHYVKVYTTQGSDLVRYRFADAVRDMKGLRGAQVHRSHWVRLKAIDPSADIGANGRALKLLDGRTIPVSQSYMGVLRMLDIV